MKIGTQINKLHKKVKAERKYKQESDFERKAGYLFTNSEKGQIKKKIMQETKIKLEFLQHLLDIIEAGATGFELAYEVEKNQEIKSLIYDGILFYNTFIEIGNNKFLDAPDKIKKDYQSFRTIEDTEKYIFMLWLKDTIDSLEKEVQSKESYAQFVEAKRVQEAEDALKKLRENLTHCKNCGAKIKGTEQILCEECGEDIMDSIIHK